MINSCGLLMTALISISFFASQQVMGKDSNSHPVVQQTTELPSCLNGTNVTNEVSYLCGLVCDTYYYSHLTTLPPDYECTVNHDIYGKFQTWYICEDIISAKYSYYKEDSWGACNFVGDNVDFVLGQKVDNTELCDFKVTYKTGPASTDPAVLDCMTINVLTTTAEDRSKTLNFGIQLAFILGLYSICF